MRSFCISSVPTPAINIETRSNDHCESVGTALVAPAGAGGAAIRLAKWTEELFAGLGSDADPEMLTVCVMEPAPAVTLATTVRVPDAPDARVPAAKLTELLL